MGANVGTFSCLVGNELDEGRVIPIEPYPPNIAELRRNLNNNNIEHSIVPLALSDTKASRIFHAIDTDERGTREGSIDNNYADIGRAVDSTTIITIPGDDLIDEYDFPAPDILKIDVEGVGPEVLEGLSDTLDHGNCRLVIVEPHDNTDEVKLVLGRLGFDIEKITVSGGLPRIVGLNR